MICKELIAYLSGFAPDRPVAVVIGDPEKRIRHKVSKVFLIEGEAALMFETIESEALDWVVGEAGEGITEEIQQEDGNGR